MTSGLFLSKVHSVARKIGSEVTELVVSSTTSFLQLYSCSLCSKLLILLNITTVYWSNHWLWDGIISSANGISLRFSAQQGTKLVITKCENHVVVEHKRRKDSDRNKFVWMANQKEIIIATKFSQNPHPQAAQEAALSSLKCTIRDDQRKRSRDPFAVSLYRESESVKVKYFNILTISDVYFCSLAS